MPLSGVPLGELWSQEILRLPRVLREKYEALLTACGFIAEARIGAGGRGVIGGDTAEEAKGHLIHRFPVSGARMQFMMVSGREQLRPAASDLISAFSEGRIRLLDVPCGAGASSVTFISLLSELRQKGCLPTTPLNIDVLGGDTSAPARGYFSELYRELIPGWHASGLVVQAHEMEWDARRGDSTASLMDRFLDERAQRPDEYVVVISNFSGEASRAAFFDEFSPCLEQILARLSSKRFTLVWIEPGISGAGDLLHRLLDFFGRRARWILPDLGTTDVGFQFQMENPIRQNIHEARLRLLRHYRR